MTEPSDVAGRPRQTSADLAVQLYTLRARLAEDLDGTLAAIAATGLEIVEPFDLLRVGDALARALPAAGLRARTAHVALLDADLDDVAAIATRLGIDTVVQPWTEPNGWTTRDGIETLAAELNTAARRLEPVGLRVGYHNHHFELATLIDGRHALEVVAELLAPEVVLEVDTYWAMAGGADVAALLERLGGRVVALHIKDGDGSLDTKRQVPVGRGRLPVREILAAAPDALRVIELDDTDGDLLDAVRLSRETLAGLIDG